MPMEAAQSARLTAKPANAKEIHAGAFLAPPAPQATNYQAAHVC